MKNPFFSPSKLPFQAPPFDKIKESDYLPAFEEGMKEQLEEIKKIADNPAHPTFENTLVKLEESGQFRPVFSPGLHHQRILTSPARFKLIEGI